MYWARSRPVAAKQPSEVARSQAGRLAAVDLKTRIEAAIGRSDLGEAHRLLDDSYREAPQPEKLYLLAVLAQAEGRRIESVDLFRRFLAEPNTETAGAHAVAKRAVPSLFRFMERSLFKVTVGLW